MVTSAELSFYDSVKDNCQIIFDIGCREDIFYIEMDAGKEFHLFEPNPFFYQNCLAKIRDIQNNIVRLNNFGLGNFTTTCDYYEDSQSFIKREKHFVSRSTPLQLSIKRASEYLSENGIAKIDFLKIDTEGCEPNILADIADFIRGSVKYIQFEYASTWLDRKDNIQLADVMNTFYDVFDFYFLFNCEHPISKIYPQEKTPITSQAMIDEINQYMSQGYGFEIAMVRKGL